MLAGSGLAADLRTAAQQMSDRAFALLNSLSARSGGGRVDPVLGPMAVFASDSQSLADVAAHGDITAAAHEASQLAIDKAAVDAAIAANPGAINKDDWNNIERQLESINAQIAGSTGKPVTAASAPSAVGGSAAARTSPISSGAASTPFTAATAPTAPETESTRGNAPPRVVIESRETSNDVVHIKGYMEGTALKSAGIYENGRRLKSFNVSGVPGEQKVEFDIGLRDAGPDTTLRLTDAKGRSAEARVTDETASAEAPTLAPSSETAETPPPDSANVPAAVPDAGVEVDRSSRSSSVDTDNTAEIPSHGPVRPSPSKRHALGGNLGNVQINITGVTQTQTLPPTYDVVGRIAGRGLTRAGIYVDGRLVKKIPIDDGANYTSFDQHFIMNGGSATIRAYSVGDQFVESSIDLPGGVTAMAPGVAAVPTAPTGLAVQITALRPIAANLYLVAGVISGRDIASAGLYQNGVLVQNLNLGSGIAGMLGALIPNTYRSVNFSTRFNLYAGQASIRAFDTSGAYTEQPIVVAGLNPYANPYAGATSPFAAPVNPYYGTPPARPYIGGASPFISRPGTPARPLW